MFGAILSDLQLSLLLAGGALVIGVFFYGKWQERKHRREAEQAFNFAHADVLLEPSGSDEVGIKRVEPTNKPKLETTLPEDEASDAAPEQTAGQDQATASQPPLPPLPIIHPAIDYIAGLELADPLAVTDLWAAFKESALLLTKPCHWLGLSEDESTWDLLDAHNLKHYSQLRAAIQLADRSGQLSESDLNTFLGSLQLLSRQFGSAISLPMRSDILAQASDLDSFCAEVDVQIGINVVSSDLDSWGSARLKEAINWAGISALNDRMFHAVDGDGKVIFTLTNKEQTPLTTENMDSLRTHGLTLILDVPCVADGERVFDRMVKTARQLAERLDGKVIDDKRNPLNDAALKPIRVKIIEFQQRMAQRGIPAGGELALRLFH